MQDQNPFGRRIVQARPGQLDLLHLAQNAAAEVLDGIVSGCAVWIRAELTVHLVKGGVNLDHFGGAKVDQLVKG